PRSCVPSRALRLRRGDPVLMTADDTTGRAETLSTRRLPVARRDGETSSRGGSRRDPSARRRAAIAILDFGSQYTQLIARRVRESRVYCEIVPHDIGADELRPR